MFVIINAFFSGAALAAGINAIVRSWAGWAFLDGIAFVANLAIAIYELKKIRRSTP